MEFIFTIVLFILILGFLVFVHELGHFLAAKLTGVYVKEFALGFGPEIIAREYKGTLYKINALPLGGYVNLEGEEDSESPNGFRNKPFWAKAFILSAGVIMNFLTAVVLLAFFLSANNNTYILPATSEYTFQNVDKQDRLFPIVFIDQPENWSNIEERDLIVSINSENFDSFESFLTTVNENRGDNVNATFLDIRKFQLYDKQILIGENIQAADVLIVLENINEESPLSGLAQNGEKILSIQGQEFTSLANFLQVLRSNAGDQVEFRILSVENQERSVMVDLPEPDSAGSILKANVIADYGFQAFPIQDPSGVYFVQYASNFLAPLSFTVDLTAYQLRVLGNIFSDAFSTGDFNQVSEAVGGPIAVGNVVGQVVSVDQLAALIPITALISLSLAIFNILPIPALDGGQILIAGIEAVSRRKLPDSFVQKFNALGFIFLMFLFVLIMFKDLMHFRVFEQLENIIQNIFGK